MTNRVVYVCLLILLWASPSVAESRLLGDNQLDSITAGQTDLQSPSQGNVTSTGGNGSAVVPSTAGPADPSGESQPVGGALNFVNGAQTPVGAEPSEAINPGPTDEQDPHSKRSHETIVGNGSTASLFIRERVELSEAAQQNSRALDLSNAANSDVVNAVNFWNLGRPGAFDLAPNFGFQVNQSNTVTQSQRSLASVGNWMLGGPNITEFSRTTSSSSGFSSHSFTSSSVSRSFSSRSVDIVTSASVPEFNPFNSFLQFPPIAPNPITIPKVGFDFGIASASVGPTTFSPGAITLPGLDLRQETLTLSGGSIKLPSLKSSVKLSGGICPVCATVTFPINISAGALGTIPIPAIPLGPNPFFGTHVQAGGGVAGAGSGTLKAGAGSVNMTVGFKLQLPSIRGFRLKFPDVSTPAVKVGKVTVIPAITAKGPTITLPGITFPSVEVNLPLVTETLGGFTLSFDNAAFCVAIPLSCTASGSASFSDVSEIFTSSTFSETSQTSSTESSSSESSREVLFPASLSEAEAEYLAMSEGTLSVDLESIVSLAGTAQENLRALTGVNATSAIVANALNVANTGRINLQATGISGFKLNQGNVFVQQR